MSALDAAAFDAFLERGGRKAERYQPRTKEAMRSTAERLYRLWLLGRAHEWAVNPQTRMCVARLMAWSEEVPLHAEFIKALQHYLVEFRRPKRNQPTRSIDDEAWKRLWTELAARRNGGRPEAGVLMLQCAIACRVGDALRISRSQVLAGFTGSDRKIDLTVKGGAPRTKSIDGALEEWSYFAAEFRKHPQAANIAQLITPGNPSHKSGDAAYKRVRLELQEVAAAAKVELHVHTHRIRRTVAVQAFNAGADIMLVKELLDQKSIVTTAGYLDESRTDAVTELQKKLQGRR